MNTMTAAQMRTILVHLDSIKELTDRLRREHFDVPWALVAGAAGGEQVIRSLLYGAALADVGIEQEETR